MGGCEILISSFNQNYYTGISPSFPEDEGVTEKLFSFNLNLAEINFEHVKSTSNAEKNTTKRKSVLKSKADECEKHETVSPS